MAHLFGLLAKGAWGHEPNKKTLPMGGRVENRRTGGLSADDVARLKAFGAFEEIELHGLTLVERAVAVLLDGGKMDENVVSRGALDETVSF